MSFVVSFSDCFCAAPPTPQPPPAAATTTAAAAPAAGHNTGVSYCLAGRSQLRSSAFFSLSPLRVILGRGLLRKELPFSILQCSRLMSPMPSAWSRFSSSLGGRLFFFLQKMRSSTEMNPAGNSCLHKLIYFSCFQRNPQMNFVPLFFHYARPYIEIYSAKSYRF